jgi:UDP-4-amino-4,6-dideoxy-N-acetyl-beta-L-altrosamine N-acetyltransferase
MNNLIRGNKVVLRDIRDSDIEAMAAWRNDPEINKYFFEYQPVSVEQQQQWVDSLRKRNDERLFIIAPVEQPNQPVGTVGLVRMDFRNRKAEWGRFLLDPSSRGKGFAAEALYLSLRYAFHHLNMQRLYLEVYEWNEPARSLYESFGFKLEGTFRNHIYREGRYHNVLVYGLLESEFRANEKRLRDNLKIALSSQE